MQSVSDTCIESLMKDLSEKEKAEVFASFQN